MAAGVAERESNLPTVTQQVCGVRILIVFPQSGIILRLHAVLWGTAPLHKYTQHLGGVKAVLQESPPQVARTLEGGDTPRSGEKVANLPSGTAATTVGQELSAFDPDVAHFTDEEFEAPRG